MSEPFRPNPLRLAFGLMRLPKNPDGSIDIPQVCEMTDHFIAAGGTYFDTAFVYDGGDSEKAFKYISRARIAIETIADSFNDRFLAEEFRVHANNLRTAYDLLSAYGDFKEV